MKPSTQALFVVLAVLAGPCEWSGRLHAAEWSIPMAGNAFRTAPGPGGSGIQRDGTTTWGDPGTVVTVYFHVDRPAELELSINAKTTPGGSTLATSIGAKTFRTVINGEQLADHRIGRATVAKAGYVRVDFKGLKRSGKTYAAIHSLRVVSATSGLAVDYVKTNKGNMFYWGRRGPSVHLRYEVPRGRKLRYAYTEVTVPCGQDPIGSFFMANGFSEGYFGFQVNGPKERRVLFSVWSPFKTNNPRDIPKDQRITALASGSRVHVGKFGNEGSGGQSYLVYPWKAGRCYRFLTEVKPDGKGNTTYTSWFGDKTAGEWQLIASFRRPRTNTNLRGFHSFLESFSVVHGYIGRRALYGNVWVRDVDGQWHECTRARFSVDPTGGGRHRLDFTGGAKGGHFYLRNCGFFDETGRPGATFMRKSSTDGHPTIKFVEATGSR